LKLFVSLYKKYSIKDLITYINESFFLYSKKNIYFKLHQELSLRKFIQNKDEKYHLIFQKPRSGKSILILSMCKHLLKTYKKILILTSIPDTIQSFIQDLQNYNDFINISYLEQKETIRIDFSGIVFSSVQYFKTKNEKKKEYLIDFDCVFIDESHHTSSNDRTDNDILQACGNVKKIVFSSGTPSKTIRYYKIKQKNIYEWNLMDEKNVHNKDYMIAKHGQLYLDCYHDDTLNKDYSLCPTQVLMKHTISKTLIEKIKKYGNNYGYSCYSLFELRKHVKNKELVFDMENNYGKFSICDSEDGKEVLIDFLETIISNNPMNKDTVMKQIEKVQTINGSRKSTIKNPLLFIMYLPTQNIYLLQKTLKNFIEENGLWKKYNIEYSNSIADSNNSREEYNIFIQDIIEKTKKNKKVGCILFLGAKGTTGITYYNCDVTISIDNCHSLDNQKQKYARCMTEAKYKTIGINVDMNIQRTYNYLLDVIQNYKKCVNMNSSIEEILVYLYEAKVFLFNPQEFNYGKCILDDIKKYYTQEAFHITENITVMELLDSIECKDELRDLILLNNSKSSKIIDGPQFDCPFAVKEKTLVLIQAKELEIKLLDTEIIEVFNKTKELCRTFLIPLISLLSRIHDIYDFNDVIEECEIKITNLLKSKIKNLNYKIFSKVMRSILNDNEDIIQQIREIYRNASPALLRSLIEKHFVPSNDEKQNNAEISTPVTLIDEMLNTIPISFWEKTHKIFEPCCGKGNFVLAIYDKFYKNLPIEDPQEKSRVILEECLFYADITEMNVFITTELLRCHAPLHTGNYNSHVGDTLQLTKWNDFDAVIGNPPYMTNPSLQNTTTVYNLFIENLVEKTQKLLFVIPSRWFLGGKGLDGFRQKMIKRKDIVLIQTDNNKSWFNNVSIAGGCNYFLLDKSYRGNCKFNGKEYDLSKYDCIIKPEYHILVDKIIKMESLNKIYIGRFFGIETNDKRLKDIGNIKCYVSYKKSKDRIKYIDEYKFNENNTFWKVIVTEASANDFGEMFIGKPKEVHSGSYVSFKVNNENEAKSLLSYLKTNFANYMLQIRKTSQHKNGKTIKWIPLLPLDREWYDDEVSKYLDIDKNLWC
jgi:hypothetical protein